ncbi:MAG: PAS domain S-box protein [Sulfurimonas sp.]|jgi:diguanylate cyclase (GGDEF)-like protein/PAS domain S-box-containing protein
MKMNKQTILIVDDESLNISVLAEILDKEYNLLVATDGATALEIVSSQSVDIILLDIVMPLMDGYEVAYQLKQNKKTAETPFIFLTAKSDPQSIVQGFKAGAIDYISKPFAKEELLARLYNHLERYELNSELSKAKLEFETIFNQSQNGIALTDLDTNFLLVNEAYTKITGFTKEELLTKSCHGLTLEKDREKSKECIKTVLDVGYVDNFEKKCRGKDKNFQVNTSYSLMPDKKTILLNTTDITKIKDAEKKIVQYVDIMDKNIISSSTDLDGTIIDVSEAFCKLTGYSRDEFIGKNHNILRHVDIADSNYKIMWDVIISGQIWHGEVKNVKKDGSLYWVDATIFPLFNDEDIKIGYMAIRQDITDKKAKEAQQLEIQKSEEKMKKLFDHQRNIIVISDGKKLKMANKAMYNFFGIEKAEDFTRFYSDICDKFIEMDNYFSSVKVPQGENWIEVLEPLLGDARVVAMHDLENIPHAFSVSIGQFDADDFIVSLTDISSTMIEKIHLSNKVTHDKLTGALNREFLDKNLPHIVNKIADSRHLGLAILDIDFFKNVNDTFGHIAGDGVLKELTKLVVSSIRNEDFFIRWGGEEFIILIESESIESLKRALEHIRQRVAHYTFCDVGALTCSFGATLYRVGEDIDSTIQRADKALYRAKENGRNQVQIEE